VDHTISTVSQVRWRVFAKIVVVGLILAVDAACFTSVQRGFVAFMVLNCLSGWCLYGATIPECLCGLRHVMVRSKHILCCVQVLGWDEYRPLAGP
jgi:uncharacterized membrane protein